MLKTLTEQKIFGIAALVFLLAAFCSDGFYHLDEHYQILEFASYKLGISGLEDMPWEFKAKMRPSIQPWMAYWTHQFLSVLGNTNPLNVAMVLRVLSGILAITTIKLLFNTFKEQYSSNIQLILLGASFFLWFNPYLMVRFSSENWGGMLFFIAMSLLINKKSKGLYIYLSAGLLLGMSFFIRFQMAFAIIGLIGYLVYSKQFNLKSFTILLSGGVIAISTMVFLDYLFYESLVFTPWEYFNQNILLDKASNFGIDPWWKYFEWLIKDAILPFALLIITGLFLLIRSKELPVFNWIWIPFLIGHFFVGHKELRFLFPLVYILPYAVIEVWKALSPLTLTSRSISKILVSVLIVWNLGLMIYSSVTPAKSFVRIYAKSREIIEPNSVVYLASHNNEEWNYPLVYFLDPSIYFIRADSNVTLMKVDERPHYVWLKRSQIEQNRAFLGDSITATIPQWLYYFNINGWVDREKNYVLFKVKDHN
ncbi:MAG: hypothetical protein H6599_03495 [Flavobacteriales bacterium]|nr:hypothetical protein [Flavobacteriales bacterium]